MRIVFTLFLVGVLFSGASAQRPRTADPEPADKSKPAAAPKTVKAKYEGGVFGYTKTMEGTLTFDDENNRLLFKDKKPPKEISIPYDAIRQAFADTQKRQPRAATIASAVPSIYALPAHFIRKKVRYLTLQYNDPNSGVHGVTSFKLENKEVLAQVLAVLAQKTDMEQKGDVYVKKRNDPNK